MRLVFSQKAWDQYLYWADTDPKIRDRMNLLIKEAGRTPFKGIGKPEPLKGDLKGWWSRRIDHEHRFVYRIVGTGETQSLEIAQLRFHY